MTDITQLKEIDSGIWEKAILIRRVEETFLDLFSQGKLNGTVHTCIGQEFSALAFCNSLIKGDTVFSNHRCHGHYLAYTHDVEGLIAELMGKSTGTCGGIGSSQHLCKNNFYSNGIQGGIVPVAAGMALSHKLLKNGNIGMVFIGDGTLGEGVLYETMNIISKWNIPLLIVCENNFYAQSTPQSINLAGSILSRPDAFGIKTFHSNTREVARIFHEAHAAIDYVRHENKPAFCLIDTYRLKAHSKGDDDRDPAEIKKYEALDPIHQYAQNFMEQYQQILQDTNQRISSIIDRMTEEKELAFEKYYQPAYCYSSSKWDTVLDIDRRQIELINEFFYNKMQEDSRLIFMGEDVLSPYGGAFKVARDLSMKYPDQVLSTPISEAAITGIANGLALGGMKPFVEIMFGDFITLALDQIINHASKFYHMYNHQVSCPVVIRTPMGGRRGYGPTHSQTLDKFLVGIDNVSVIALNTLINPKDIYENVYQSQHPVIVLENKVDYGRKLIRKNIKNYKIEKNRDPFPCIRVSPVKSLPTVTLITYGGMLEQVIEQLEHIFIETDFLPELWGLTQIHPLNLTPVLESVKATKCVLVLEEGSGFAGIGSEIIASIAEQMPEAILYKRISALPVPIPSAKGLENRVLPTHEWIIQTLQEMKS
ncbi:MAG: pyruvate dehydrogenase [SAR324 cluster bacterium]|nr:pyruvate dehydrogenase [SAR324 cluster bacterium]